MATAEKTNSNVFEKNIEEISSKSTKAIKDLIENYSRQTLNAIEANKKLTEGIMDKYTVAGKESDVLKNIKKTFEEGVKSSERVLDTIIDLHKEQVESNIQINREMIENIKEMAINPSKIDLESLIAKINNNINANSTTSINNLKKMVALFNDHVNLSINFSDNFNKNIKSQMDLLEDISSKNLDSMNDWTNLWFDNSLYAKK